MPEPAKADRNGTGQFLPGCKPGPGNPFAKRVATLRKSLLESVSEEDVASLGRKLLEQALAGDVAASKVLLSYVVGKPTEAVDPDRVELEAWKLLLSWPTIAEAVATTLAVSPLVATAVVDRLTPGTPEEVIQQAKDPGVVAGAHKIIQRREEKGK